MRLKTGLFCFAIFMIKLGLLWAQDIPFTWGHNWGVGARAMAMGGAYTAIADDYSAMYYNPAGLGQLQGVEVFATIAYMDITNRATFKGVQTSESSNYTTLNSLGVTVPVSTYRGSLVFSFGYHNIRQFDNAIFVTKFISTPGDSVTQEYNWLEEGGLNNTSFGGSIEMAPDFFLGATINFWGGRNDYTRRFRELDQPYDIWTFSDTTSTEHILTQFSGVNFTLGTLFQGNDLFRFGGVITTPVTLKGKEDWDYSDVLTWDADSTDAYSENGWSEYRIQSPWVFRAGGVSQFGPLMISGDVEYCVYSQIRYKTDPPGGTMGMSDANLSIKRNLQNRLNYRLGAEFQIPKTSVNIRVGYAIYKSPQKNASSAQNRKIISFGAGFTLSELLVLNMGYANTSWEGAASDVIEREKIEVSKVLATLSYRI